MANVIVTGANSGIGNAFARLLIQEGYNVHAVDKTIGDGIKQLSCSHSELDVTSQKSVEAFKGSWGDKPLDMLLNIAGMMFSPAEDALTTVNHKVLETTFEVNTYGPLLLTQALLPNLLASSKPRLGVMSSRVGSIGDNTSGGSYAYRASKAAVNSLFKSLSCDLQEKGVTVLMLHPGFTKTGLSPDVHKIPEAVEPEEAAEKLYKVLMSKGLEDSGTFWHREGFELPW